MFWGLKLYSGNQYHSIVNKSFHVSHAVLEPGDDLVSVEVHVVIHKVDYIICLLNNSDGRNQQSLDLEISEGEEMTVYIKTNSEKTHVVHLTGYYIEESVETQWENVSTDEDETLLSGDEDLEGFTHLLYDNDNADTMDYPSLKHLHYQSPIIHEITSDQEPEENEVPAENKETTQNSRKRKVTIATPEEVPQKKKKPKKKKNKDDANTDTTPVTNVPVKQENYKRTLMNGTIIEELTYGSGKVAKAGRKVSIRYNGGVIGHNDLISKGQKPVTFTLGQGEVMSGLDSGIKGMRVGGKRRLLIPPSARRGRDVPPDIPVDADLTLEVELVKVL